MLFCADNFGGGPEVRTLFKGAFSGIQEPCQTVVTNKADWEALWNRHEANVEPKRPVPEVDFAAEAVLVVALGRKNTGGYSVEIVDFRKTAEGAEAIVKTKSPKPGALNIQALTAPVHMAAAPKTDGKIVFKSE